MKWILVTLTIASKNQFIVANKTRCFSLFSHEVEKFARNTGLKLFRTSVKENLNIGRVFQYLAERHIESVSRWSDESADEFSQPILQIGHHQQQTRDVRVRFANEHELNDHHQTKGSVS